MTHSKKNIQDNLMIAHFYTLIKMGIVPGAKMARMPGEAEKEAEMTAEELRAAWNARQMQTLMRHRAHRAARVRRPMRMARVFGR